MESEEPQQPAVGIPAGHQLRQAREKLGLSQKDVADAQHLRVFIIQAIEDGQYDQIDSELFLKGYVRAYAKQVSADADGLIQTLDLELEPLRRKRAQQAQEDPLVDIERRRHKKRRLAKTLVMLVVLGALAFAAWKYVLEPRLAEEPPVESEPSELDADAVIEQDPEAAAPVPVTESEPEFEDHTELLGDSDELVTDADAVGPDSAALPSQGPTVGEVPGDEAESVPASVTDSDPESAQPEVEFAAPEPVVQADPVFEESAQPESVAPPARLEMSFVSDCWVQVTDSAGARLVASLQRNGDQLSVTGRAPFNVVIGAVDAVESLRFGGESVDLSNFRVVNNRTEFTLTL